MEENKKQGFPKDLTGSICRYFERQLDSRIKMAELRKKQSSKALQEAKKSAEELQKTLDILMKNRTQKYSLAHEVKEFFSKRKVIGKNQSFMAEINQKETSRSISRNLSANLPRKKTKGDMKIKEKSSNKGVLAVKGSSFGKSLRFEGPKTKEKKSVESKRNALSKSPMKSQRKEIEKARKIEKANKFINPEKEIGISPEKIKKERETSNKSNENSKILNERKQGRTVRNKRNAKENEKTKEVLSGKLRQRNKGPILIEVASGEKENRRKSIESPKGNRKKQQKEPQNDKTNAEEDKLASSIMENKENLMKRIETDGKITPEETKNLCLISDSPLYGESLSFLCFEPLETPSETTEYAPSNLERSYIFEPRPSQCLNLDSSPYSSLVSASRKFLDVSPVSQYLHYFKILLNCENNRLRMKNEKEQKRPFLMVSSLSVLQRKKDSEPSSSSEGSEA